MGSTERGDDEREDLATEPTAPVEETAVAEPAPAQNEVEAEEPQGVEATEPASLAAPEAASPVSEPVAGPISEPTAEPISEPVAEPISEPIAEPAAERVAEPTPVPVAEPVDVRRPVADATTTAVTAPVTDVPPVLPVRTPILDAVAQVSAVDHAAGADESNGLDVRRSEAPEPRAQPVAAAPQAAAPPTVAAPSAPSTASPTPPTAAAPSAPPTAGGPGAPARAGDTAVMPPVRVSTRAQVPVDGAEATSVLPTATAGSTAATNATATSGTSASAGTSANAGMTATAVAVRSATEPAPGEPGSPLDVFESDDRPRRWPRVLAIALSIIVVIGGAYVGACYAFAGKVARGASVAGVDIGGLGADAAVTALEDGLASVTTEPITVAAGEVSGSVDPASAGLTFDAEATVDTLTGVDLRPARLWNLVFGIGAQDAVTHVDDAALEAAVETLGGSLAVAPVDGAIVFADGDPHATAAVDGAQIDADAAVATLRDQWLTAARPIELATEAVEPDITQAETDLAMTQVATPLASGPVTVQVNGQAIELPVAALTDVASFVPADSQLVLQLDGARLVEEVLARSTNLLTPSADAHFEFVDGAPVIIPGTPGTTLDPAALAAAVAAAAVTPERTAPVELVSSDPAQSTAKLEALGITANVAEFSTPLTSEPRRTANIANGAANVNGTVVLAGETFSLTEALGPITTANGYQDAGVLVNGEHVDGMGGGLSQMATTTYNAGFLAGFEDVEHRPHTEWFSRYPEGREATIYTGVLDMKWKNNTPYGALIQSWIADGKVWVRIWSTPYWTVETSTSARSDVVQPTTVYSQSPTCVNQSAGNPGFKVSVTRRLLLDGVLQDSETNAWRYKPSNKIVCGTAPEG